MTDYGEMLSNIKSILDRAEKAEGELAEANDQAKRNWELHLKSNEVVKVTSGILDRAGFPQQKEETIQYRVTRLVEDRDKWKEQAGQYRDTLLMIEDSLKWFSKQQEERKKT